MHSGPRVVHVYLFIFLFFHLVIIYEQSSALDAEEKLFKNKNKKKNFLDKRVQEAVNDIWDFSFEAISEFVLFYYCSKRLILPK